MVSIILTTYKRSANIVRRAIISIINQTYSNWELFVIDDSPSSFSGRNSVKKMLETFKYDKRIHYIQHDKNMGACAARNTGIEMSAGKYIAFLDDDDEWVDTKLEKQVKKMITCDKKIGLIYCGCFFKNDNTGIQSIAKTLFESGNVFSKLTHKNFIGGASFPLIKKNCLKKIGNFDECMESCQDLDVWLKISKFFLIDYVPEPLVIYHIHDGDQISKNINKIIAGREKIINKNMDYFKKNKKDYWLCMINYSYDCAFTGRRDIALKILKRAVAIKPQNIFTNFLFLLRILYITR